MAVRGGGGLRSLLFPRRPPGTPTQEEAQVLIVSRAEWGARPPRRRHRIPTPTPRLWLHHTATEGGGHGSVRAIQAFHMDVRDWADIAYSFLVDDTGTIYEGRGAGVAGGHTQGDNTTSHAICAMGNFENRAPTRPLVDSIAALVAHGHAQGWWAERKLTGGHRDAPGANTSCPGRQLYVAIGTINAMAAAIDEEDELTPEQMRELKTHFDKSLREVEVRLQQRLDAQKRSIIEALKD